MLKGSKVSSKQRSQAQKIIDLHNQVIVTTTMVPYPLAGSEAQGALVKKTIKETEKLTIEAFKKGLILLPVGVNCVRIAPPLNIPLEQLDKGLDLLFDTIKNS